MKLTHAALNILLTSPKVMFEEDVEDTTKTKGGFDDVRRELTD